MEKIGLGDWYSERKILQAEKITPLIGSLYVSERKKIANLRKREKEGECCWGDLQIQIRISKYVVKIRSRAVWGSSITGTYGHSL